MLESLTDRHNAAVANHRVTAKIFAHPPYRVAANLAFWSPYSSLVEVKNDRTAMVVSLFTESF